MNEFIGFGNERLQVRVDQTQERSQAQSTTEE